jgi:hypothetical protein
LFQTPTPRSGLPAARSACEAATGADGRIYLVGGGDSAGTVTGAGEVYTP